MILVLTDRFDTHADRVLEKLGSASSFSRLNLDAGSLQHTTVSFDGTGWLIHSDFGRIRSDQVSCVWLRRPFVEIPFEESANASTDENIWKNEWNKTLIGFYTTIRQVPWLNPLRSALQAENKYYQMEIAKSLGFNLPPTIVSNSRADLQKFSSQFETVALKLMHQTFYSGDDGKPRAFYVNQLTAADLAKFGGASENPIVLQAYLPKKYEVRYTVVGSSHFACRIESQQSLIAKTDWRRYDLPNTPHTSMTPSAKYQQQIDSMLSILDLQYGAFDFVVAPTEDWYFLEVNAMGQWLWIRDLTGMAISDSIAQWLETAERRM